MVQEVGLSLQLKTCFLAAEDERLHDNFRVQSQEFYIYEMREMCPKHALQLFSMCAFRTDFPPHDFNDLSSEIVTTKKHVICDGN